KLAVPGEIETATGFNVTMALASRVLSATLVAVTVTFCWDGIRAGAVYRPDDETPPTPPGLLAQVTAVLVVPVTVALNCCVRLAFKLALDGTTETEMLDTLPSAVTRMSSKYVA